MHFISQPLKLQITRQNFFLITNPGAHKIMEYPWGLSKTSHKIWASRKHGRIIKKFLYCHFNCIFVDFLLIDAIGLWKSKRLRPKFPLNDSTMDNPLFIRNYCFWRIPLFYILHETRGFEIYQTMFLCKNCAVNCIKSYKTVRLNNWKTSLVDFSWALKIR